MTSFEQLYNTLLGVKLSEILGNWVARNTSLESLSYDDVTCGTSSFDWMSLDVVDVSVSAATVQVQFNILKN